jgi:hypothetical protein
MAAAPLTHHEILALAAPFARRGLHVDLAASRREERQIAFKPVDHPARADGRPPLREQLRLTSHGTGSFTLMRTLAIEAGLQATLEATGDDPGALLARIESVDLDRHVRHGPGWTMARSYRFERYAGGGGAPVLARGQVRFDALALAFEVSPVRGVSAELALTPAAGLRLPLPEDLLAVIGWDWARLVPHADGWTTRMRLRGQGARRSAAAERALDRVTAHLAQVLAEPPARFHARFRLARWGVVLRRLIPTLTAIGLIVGTLLLPRIAPEQDPGFWLLLHYLPIGVLALAFMLQELPRFEIPPWPRPLRAERWAQGATAPTPLPREDAWSATR